MKEENFVSYRPNPLRYGIPKVRVIPFVFLFWMFAVLAWASFKTDPGIGIVAGAFAFVFFIVTCKKLNKLTSPKQRRFVIVVVFWAVVGVSFVAALLLSPYIGKSIALVSGMIPSYCASWLIRYYLAAVSF